MATSKTIRNLDTYKDNNNNNNNIKNEKKTIAFSKILYIIVCLKETFYIIILHKMLAFLIVRGSFKK